MLLKNYYGTGHSSMDNYLSMVSGQAPEEDTQTDCSVENTNFCSTPNSASVESLTRGQLRPGRLGRERRPADPAGRTPPNGANGCTYPTDVPTLFNQLDAAGKTWKGYAQDLGGEQTARLGDAFQSDTVPGREDAACGGPGPQPTTPTPTRRYLSAHGGNPLPSRRDQLHRRPGQRPVRRQALPVPVVRIAHRARSTATARPRRR